MLLVQLTMQSMSTYVYPNYFGNAGTVGCRRGRSCNDPSASTVVVKLQVKMGRKELAIAGSFVCAVIFFITWLTHTKNAWLYVGLYALAYLDWLHSPDLLGDDRRRYR